MIDTIEEPLAKVYELEWYSDPNDPRCPHDGWLEAFAIRAVASGDRNENASYDLSLTVLSAWAKGYIRYQYQDVSRCSLDLPKLDCAERRVDWLSDNLSICPNGHYRHVIEWEGVKWQIESRLITYRWESKV